MKPDIVTLINIETPLERELLEDNEFLAGLDYGKPRPGHPEGAVIYHIKEVLDNIDKLTAFPEERSDLRIVALIHDTFKYKVDRKKPMFGDNHHAHYAWTFAKKYISDSKVLAVILKHDDAYNIWRRARKSGNWEKAHHQAIQLCKYLGYDALELYKRFYFADNNTGDKTMEPFTWFREIAVNYQEGNL